MSDQCGNTKSGGDESGLSTQVSAYIGACRARIPAFVTANYAGRGAVGLNRRAFGTDVLVAPYNFLMGFPNFVLRVLALALELVGAGKAASRLAGSPLGLKTNVQKALAARLVTDLLALPLSPDDARDPLRRQIWAAAREPVRIYVRTRNVAADITAGTLAAVMGLAFLHQFTPGSISAGSAIAQVVARDQAVSHFALGETLGRLYYAAFPVSPSQATLALTLLAVMTTVAVITAFSGFLHDPVQTAAGIHRRRLEQMLDAIAEIASRPASKGYRPKDTFFGRVYDLMDWIKGLLSF
jgi:hypothetical protein